MNAPLRIGLVTYIGAVATALATAGTYEGYTFYASGSTAYLVDMAGTTVHTWKGGGSAVCEAYLLDDGSALFPISNNCSVRTDGAHPSGRIQKISWDGSITWDYSYCPSDYGPGYDIEPMPNGNVLLPADNSSSAGIIYEIKPSGSSAGEIVWQYALPDSLNSSGSSSSGPGGMGGGTYINSVSYNPDLDYILVDLQDPVRKFVVIDHRAPGKVVFTYTIATSGRVHGAKWSTPYYLGTKTRIPDADTAAMRINNMLVVHNTSEVVEVNMASNSKVKSFSFSFSNNEGSVQRLPNGNTLVQKGMDQTTIAELDTSGKQIATITAKGRCSRAYRYGADFPGLAKLNPATIYGGTQKAPSPGVTVCFDRRSGTCRLSLPPTACQSVTVTICTLSGALVLATRASGAHPSISTRGLRQGVYFVNIESPTGSFRSEFINLH